MHPGKLVLLESRHRGRLARRESRHRNGCPHQSGCRHCRFPEELPMLVE
jgi:hypothetical protein